MTNIYELGSQKIIPAVLLYAFYQNQILMIEKNVWNGLGGKLDQGETALDAAVREFQEEANCNTSGAQWTWLGQLFFPNFKPHKNEDWWVTVFTTELNDLQMAEIRNSNFKSPEGTLHLIPIEKLMELNLWQGDRHFLPLVLKGQAFQGTFFYENGNCIRHEISPIAP